MSWIQLAGAIALATSSGNGVAATEIVVAAEPVLTETLVLQDERYRRMTVPVLINGQGPFNFLIDTGAEASVLSHALADQLQLNDRDTALLVGTASERAG